ncbi:MAG TPA: hypothetical protein PK580_09370 [Nitrosomonas halophila]|nr:hypothetical protein [Nitrosomonas halophila]
MPPALIAPDNHLAIMAVLFTIAAPAYDFVFDYFMPVLIPRLSSRLISGGFFSR